MIKLYTSYYANMKNIPATYLMVGISRTCPEWLKENTSDNFLWTPNNILAPPASLLSDIKSGKIDQNQYTERYKEHIHYIFSHNRDFRDVQDWYENMNDEFEDKYDAVVFLCYEKPTDFCHRHILREMLNYEYRIRCDELNYKEETEETQKRNVSAKSNALF